MAKGQMRSNKEKKKPKADKKKQGSSAPSAYAQRYGMEQPKSSPNPFTKKA